MDVNPNNKGTYCDICCEPMFNKSSLRFTPPEGHSEKYYMCIKCWSDVSDYMRNLYVEYAKDPRMSPKAP
jgi:RNase P subunit RPR2